MNRRQVLSAGLASTMALLAGCSDDTEDLIEDANDSEDDGLGPAGG